MFDIALTILVVTAAIAWAGWRVLRTAKGQGGCDHCATNSTPVGNAAKVQAACGCTGCPLHASCTEKQQPGPKSPLA